MKSKQEIIDDVLAGNSLDIPSSTPNYAGSGGVGLGDNTGVRLGNPGVFVPPTQVMWENMIAKFGTLERVNEAHEDLLRRIITKIGEFEGRVAVMESALGVQKGLRV